MSLQQRIDYVSRPLIEDDAPDDPMVLFEQWFAEASAVGIAEPNAMTVATVDGEGNPDARILLLRGADRLGFTFFTNYESAKGRQLAGRGQAALVFFWQPLHRQVRVRGAVERVGESESAEYFASRPRMSQLGAWASRQSEAIASRGELDAAFDAVSRRFDGDAAIPKPPFWGGFRVVPESIEFWQGREGRLHDRLRYRRGASGAWQRERLSP